jgi:predicted nucleic acid-binding protein
MPPIHKPIVLDNDVVCVLFLAGVLVRLLSLWPRGRFFITAQVRDEANKWPSRGKELVTLIDQLEAQGIITTITIDDSSEDEIIAYSILCLGKKIGNGESASIAIAQNRGYDVATNDGDAREHCHELFPTVRTWGSGALLSWAITDGLISVDEGEKIRKAMDSCFIR